MAFMKFTMIKIHKYYLVFFLAVSLVGCSEYKLAGDINVDWDKDGRSYKAIVNDEDGNACVQLVCQYIGKKPEEPLDHNITRDWKTEDTDFYHYKMINLTDKPIELVNVSFRLKTGKDGKVFDTKTQKAIDRDWGGHIIPSRGSLTRRNSIVWGKKDENILHKIYLARTNGNKFEIDTQLVYKR